MAQKLLDKEVQKKMAYFLGLSESSHAVVHLLKGICVSSVLCARRYATAVHHGDSHEWNSRLARQTFGSTVDDIIFSAFLRPLILVREVRAKDVHIVAYGIILLSVVLLIQEGLYVAYGRL